MLIDWSVSSMCPMFLNEIHHCTDGSRYKTITFNTILNTAQQGTHTQYNTVICHTLIMHTLSSPGKRYNAVISPYTHDAHPLVCLWGELRNVHCGCMGKKKNDSVTSVRGRTKGCTLWWGIWPCDIGTVLFMANQGRMEYTWEACSFDIGKYIEPLSNFYPL